MYSLKQESLSVHHSSKSTLSSYTYFSTLKSKLRRIYRHKYRSLVLILFILPILIFSSNSSNSSEFTSSSTNSKHNSIIKNAQENLHQQNQNEINQRHQRTRQLFKRDISSSNIHDPEPFPILQDQSSAEMIKPPEKNKSGQLFPPDLFTLEERRQGWVILYILGVTYMFVALAIVCDEFFVPSLDVIIEKMEIADDVAGATFMAAGGSAPELFTSVIGVFISHDDVGIGTIVGSAVFNILFVIGMCALFSRTVLHLTWWPLFRDCTFYSIALLTLISFFYDSHIYWWEAFILLMVYVSYVLFMKFNQGIERWIKKVLYKNKVTRVGSSDQLVVASGGKSPTTSSTTPGSQTSSVVTVAGSGVNTTVPPGGIASTSSSHRGSSGTNPGITGGRRNSIPLLHSGTKFRHGLLQLMIQSIDPLNDGRIDEKATQLHAIASLKALLDAAKADTNLSVKENNQKRPIETSNYQSGGAGGPGNGGLENMASVDIEDGRADGINGGANNGTGDLTAKELATLDSLEASALEPLDISWPSSDWRKQVSYVMLFPIMIVLYLTLPDTRTPRGKKFFVWGFLGSILWIAIFSYFMVWWADRTGETFRIPPEIMGLTFLAAGTSIPDLITSVIVARKGLGDMAVSSSIGSNIFDVCVGLPVPWLLYTLYEGHSIQVQAKGMLCSVAILFGMLVFVVMSIMLFRWRMNKGLGTVMFLLYFVFLAVSLLFEYEVWTCPKFGREDVTTTTMSPFT